MDKRELAPWGIEVEEIPSEGLSVSFEDLTDLGGDLTIVKPFSGSLFLTKRGSEVKVKGNLTGAIRLTCDRCLVEYEFPCQVDFEVLLCPKSSLNLEEKKELSLDELDVAFYERDFISFLDVIREEVLLAIPYKRLCEPKCKGLCPVCGKNLKEGGCQCKPFKKSSPFAILKDLFSTSKAF